MSTKKKLAVLLAILALAACCGAGRIWLAAKAQFLPSAVNKIVYLAVYTILPVAGCFMAGVATALALRWFAGLSGHWAFFVLSVVAVIYLVGCLGLLWGTALLSVKKYADVINVLFSLVAYYPYWVIPIGFAAGLIGRQRKLEGTRGR